MHFKEKDFLNIKHNTYLRNRLRKEYQSARNIFDKTLKAHERNYRKQQATDIETLNTNNPNEFWNKIKQLGPRKDNTIPIEITDTNNNTTTDEHSVFDKWKTDFEQ